MRYVIKALLDQIRILAPLTQVRWRLNQLVVKIDVDRALANRIKIQPHLKTPQEEEEGGGATGSGGWRGSPAAGRTFQPWSLC